MAIIDTYGELSDAQSLSAIGLGSAASTDIIDLTQYDKSFGVADGNYLNITCNTTATSAGSAATVTIKLCKDTVAPIDGSSTVIYQTAPLTIGSDELTAYDGKTKGQILCMPLPDNIDDTGATDAVIGLYITVGTEACTAGAIDAWIGPPMQSRYDSQRAASNV
jgi:hypothetical protein